MAKVWLEIVVKRQFVSLLLFVTPSMYSDSLIVYKVSLSPRHNKKRSQNLMVALYVFIFFLYKKKSHHLHCTHHKKGVHNMWKVMSSQNASSVFFFFGINVLFLYNCLFLLKCGKNLFFLSKQYGICSNKMWQTCIFTCTHKSKTGP